MKDLVCLRLLLWWERAWWAYALNGNNNEPWIGGWGCWTTEDMYLKQPKQEGGETLPEEETIAELNCPEWAAAGRGEGGGPGKGDSTAL